MAIYEEKPLVVVTPSYKNIQWFKANVQSILAQKYHSYRVIYIDDCSPDGTGEAIREYLDEHQVDYRQIFFDDSFSDDINQVVDQFITQINEEKHFFILVRNTRRCGALANLYRGIYSCQDREIILTLDGDDWFYDEEVLKRVNEAYSSNNVWLTHGCLIEYPGNRTSWCEPIPPYIIEQNAFRKFKCPSHLRTFYVWLFKKIRLEDLLFEGHFYPMAWDMAMMYPMIEMAGERHAYLSRVNLVYNMANQINDNKVNPHLQNYLDQLIRHKQPYERLLQAPISVF